MLPSMLLQWRAVRYIAVMNLCQCPTTHTQSHLNWCTFVGSAQRRGTGEQCWIIKIMITPNWQKAETWETLSLCALLFLALCNLDFKHQQCVWRVHHQVQIFLCKRGSRCVIFQNATMPHLFFFFSCDTCCISQETNEKNNLLLVHYAG